MRGVALEKGVGRVSRGPVPRILHLTRDQFLLLFFLVLVLSNQTKSSFSGMAFCVTCCMLVADVCLVRWHLLRVSVVVMSHADLIQLMIG